jgi:hypothetical protein
MKTGPDVEYPGVVEDLGWMQARCRLSSSGVQRVRFSQSVSQFSPVQSSLLGSYRVQKMDPYRQIAPPFCFGRER